MLENIAKINSNISNKFNLNKNVNISRNFFESKNIAVIDASDDFNEIGAKIFSKLKKNVNLNVFPINLAWANVQNQKAYTNLTLIDKKIDLVIITKSDVKNIIFTIKDAIKINVRNILFLSKIHLNENTDLIVQINKLIIENNLNIIGLNSFGFLNVKEKINVLEEDIDCVLGNFSFISKNIKENEDLFDYCLNNNIGFSKIVDLGKNNFMSISKVLEYFKDDRNTKNIIIEIDNINIDINFEKILHEISSFKKIIIFSRSYNSKLKLLKEVINNSGAFFINDVDELKSLIKILNSKNTIKNKNNVFSISNSNFLSLSLIEKIEKSKLINYRLNDNQVYNFSSISKEINFDNPLILKDCFNLDYFSKVLNLVSKLDVEYIILSIKYDKKIDYLEVLNEIIRVNNISNKMILVNTFGGGKLEKFVNRLIENKIPVFENQNEMIKTLKLIKNSFDNNKLIKEDYYNFDKQRVDFVLNEIKKYDKYLPNNLIFEIFNNILAVNIEKPIIINSLFEINNVFLEENEIYLLKGVGIEKDNEEILSNNIIYNVDYNNFKEKIHILFDKMFEQYNSFYIKLEKERVGFEINLEFIMSNISDFIKIKSKNSNFENEILIKLPTNKITILNKLRKFGIDSELNLFRGTNNNFDNLCEIINRISNLKKIFKNLNKIQINKIILNENGIFLEDIILKK